MAITRSPLAEVHNASAVAPQQGTSKLKRHAALPSGRLRRVKSVRDFVSVDSSEGPPSEHPSVYDAFRYSSAGASDSNGGGSQENTPPRRQELALDFLPPREEWRYGVPLATINERPSAAFLRPVRSYEDFHHDQLLPPTIPIRRKRSTSLDDSHLYPRYPLPPTAPLVHSNLSSKSVYTQPVQPPFPPFKRPSTPEGMMSWDESQRQTLSLSDRRGRQRQSKTRTLFSYLFPCFIKSKVIDNQRRAPRFRVHRSGHSQFTELNLHPFHRAQTAPVQKPRSGDPSAQQRRTEGQGLGQVSVIRRDHLDETAAPTSSPIFQDTVDRHVHFAPGPLLAVASTQPNPIATATLVTSRSSSTSTTPLFVPSQSVRQRLCACHHNLHIPLQNNPHPPGDSSASSGSDHGKQKKC